MSLKGAILRGKNLYSFRDIDGNLPNIISSDEHKMAEIKIYLESLPKAKKPEVKE